MRFVGSAGVAADRERGGDDAAVAMRGELSTSAARPPFFNMSASENGSPAMSVPGVGVGDGWEGFSRGAAATHLRAGLPVALSEASRPFKETGRRALRWCRRGIRLMFRKQRGGGAQAPFAAGEGALDAEPVFQVETNVHVAALCLLGCDPTAQGPSQLGP